jgi:iron complex outermembrane receptor protein
MAGLRLDSDRIAYTERYPEEGYGDHRSYSEFSLSAGLSRQISSRHTLYASYGEAFLPPTTEELFSFPLYGSNRNLRPEDSRSFEIGFRGRWAGGPALDAALFMTDTSDEIVFDPDAPPGLFGTNINAGETRRKGIEISLRGELTRHAGYFVNATLLAAEFRAGEIRGNEVPLVPGERYAAGLDLKLPGGLGLRTELLHVGEQTLSNDDLNVREPLDAYTVVDLRASWALPGSEEISLYADVTNLFDRKYATRGIYAYDFINFVYDDFFTPAPGRRVRTGAKWRF